MDPFHHSTVQKPSHVVHSRLDDRALAVEAAAADLRPARMGGTTVDSRIYKGNIAGPGRADDGTPAGYPDDHADFVMSIVRWAHVGHAQTERDARYLADSIVAGWTSARLLRCGGSRRRTCR